MSELVRVEPSGGMTKVVGIVISASLVGVVLAKSYISLYDMERHNEGRQGFVGV